MKIDVDYNWWDSAKCIMEEEDMADIRGELSSDIIQMMNKGEESGEFKSLSDIDEETTQIIYLALMEGMSLAGDVINWHLKYDDELDPKIHDSMFTCREIIIDTLFDKKEPSE